MADKLMSPPMMIHKNTPSVDYNQWLKRLDTLLYQPIKLPLKSPILLSQQIRKFYSKTLGTRVINSQMSIPCPDIYLVNLQLNREYPYICL